jgi:AraC-like DNA-binding protein
MSGARVFSSSGISVIDYRCTLGPGDRPFPEVHRCFSLSYVRKGSFSCRTRARSFELVAGAILVGRPGDEYTCSHEHHICGDECLSFQFAADFVESLGNTKAWRVGAIPPLASLMVVGELAQAAVDEKSDIGPDEAGMMLAERFAASASDNIVIEEIAARDRRRAVEAALWIGEHAHEAIDLAAVSRFAGVSPFHFLRSFARTIGVTPHQYLVRCRLKRAARLLAEREPAITDVALDCGFNDLSNFIRTFRRAAGVSPRGFRRASKGDRKKVQDRLAAFA